MDVDEILDDQLAESLIREGDDIVEPKSSNKRIKVVLVDDEHPFELDAYIANYSGRMTVYRLLHIARHCPSLAPTATDLAIQYILQSSNISLYLATIQHYNALPSITDPIPVDQKWVEEMSTKTSQERNKLEVELKQYTSNMIKESIRMGHRDLGDFHLSIGDYNAALKSYTKSREFCTTGQHVIDMCISILQLLIQQRNYAHIATYIFKAEAALEAAGSKNDQPKTGIANRDSIQTKIEFATALGHFGQSNYERAAYLFLNLGPAKGLGDWLGTLVAPGDIAIYGTLCALASLSRSAIKANVIESQIFSGYMEHEPYVREMIEAYMNSKFKTVLEILERFSSRHYLDIHLFSHVQELTSLIRDRALVLYFQPFQSIRLERMSEAFGMSVEEIEQHVIRLIQDGSIKARVDSQNKILQGRGQDPRTAMFTKAVESGSRIQETNRKLLFRMKLMQADLVVKTPKNHGTAPQRHEATVHEMLLE
ncbi:G protein pathway suppressor 1 [Hysterangium stoloniferum]|nr:G protein pathway suppressor 1 [Hysterangium stoloniferum]